MSFQSGFVESGCTLKRPRSYSVSFDCAFLLICVMWTCAGNNNLVLIDSRRARGHGDSGDMSTFETLGRCRWKTMLWSAESSFLSRTFHNPTTIEQDFRRIISLVASLYQFPIKLVYFFVRILFTFWKPPSKSFNCDVTNFWLERERLPFDLGSPQGNQMLAICAINARVDGDSVPLRTMFRAWGNLCYVSWTRILELG